MASGNVPTDKQAEVAHRRGACVRMRREGKHWQTIVDALGYASTGAAATDLKRALNDARRDTALEVSQYREVELQRLDDLEAKVRSVLDGAHITVSHGRVVKDEDGAALPDHDPLMRAADRLLKIAERRARLLGLDQPVKHEVSGQVTYAIEGVNLDKLM